MKKIIEYYQIGKLDSYGKMLCPFHTEKKAPSFSVRRTGDINFGSCFGCNWSGDSVNLVSKWLNISRFEAAKQIINDFHIPIDIQIDSKEDIEKRKKDWKRKKYIEWRLNKYIYQTEDRFFKLYRKSKQWLNENQDKKFTLDYQICLYIYDFTDRFSDWIIKNYDKPLLEVLDVCINSNIKFKTDWWNKKFLIDDKILNQKSIFKECFW